MCRARPASRVPERCSEKEEPMATLNSSYNDENILLR